MIDKNICRFIVPSAYEDFIVSTFVLETNRQTMERQIELTENRIILISKGDGAIYCNEQRFDFTEGCLIFAFIGESVRVEGQDVEFFYVNFNGSRSHGLFSRFAIGKFNRIFGGFDGLIPLWRESIARSNDQNIDLVAESIVLNAFSRLTATDNSENAVIDKIIKISEERFSDTELSISAIAEELGYNAKYLSSLFKKSTGVTYSEYLRSIRIRFAVTLFDNGLELVKNVALLSGFSDPLYFSAIFKKCVGVSPKDYQKRRLNGV